MAYASVPPKSAGDHVTNTELNSIVTAVNTKSDGARKAFPFSSPVSTGTDLVHNFGTLLGLVANQYHLEVRAYDSNGDLVSGIRIQKTGDNKGTLSFVDTTLTFTGTIILDLTILS